MVASGVRTINYLPKYSDGLNARARRLSGTKWNGFGADERIHTRVSAGGRPAAVTNKVMSVFLRTRSFGSHTHIQRQH